MKNPHLIYLMVKTILSSKIRNKMISTHSLLFITTGASSKGN